MMNIERSDIMQKMFGTRSDECIHVLEDWAEVATHRSPCELGELWHMCTRTSLRVLGMDLRKDMMSARYGTGPVVLIDRSIHLIVTSFRMARLL